MHRGNFAVASSIEAAAIPGADRMRDSFFLPADRGTQFLRARAASRCCVPETQSETHEMIAEKKTLTVRAANDHGADAAAYDTIVLTVARMLARYSAQASKAANDNCRPEAT